MQYAQTLTDQPGFQALPVLQIIPSDPQFGEYEPGADADIAELMQKGDYYREG